MTTPRPTPAAGQRRPERDPVELRGRWSALHHDIDPTSMPLVTGWLRGMWFGAAALSRTGIRPTAVTVTGVVLAGGAVRTARYRPVAAAVLVLGAALCDGLDGALAVVSDHATRSGARADAVADRCCDAAFALVLGRRGAPTTLAVAAGATAIGVDTLRRVRRTPAKVTVAERPTFTICAVLACLGGARQRSRWPATTSALAWIGAGLVAVGQLLVTPRPLAGPAASGT